MIYYQPCISKRRFLKCAGRYISRLPHLTKRIFKVPETPIHFRTLSVLCP